MSVILTTWEAEVGRIAVPGQCGQKFTRPISTEKKLGMRAHICYSHNDRRVKIGWLRSRPAAAKNKTPSANKQSKKGWRHDSSNRTPT
jgi:hypothetical protein